MKLPVYVYVVITQRNITWANAAPNNSIMVESVHSTEEAAKTKALSAYKRDTRQFRKSGGFAETSVDGLFYRFERTYDDGNKYEIIVDIQSARKL